MLLQSRSEALIPYTTNGYLLYISDRLEVKKKIWAVSGRAIKCLNSQELHSTSIDIEKHSAGGAYGN